MPNKGTSPYPEINDIEITNSGVLQVTFRLPSTQGPDNIHSSFLKNTVNELLPMLTHLFQALLSTEMIPSVWKQAYITPVYKAGPRSEARNYRPILLTSLITKTLEHVICSHLMNLTTLLLSTNMILDQDIRVKHNC